jgi:lipoprotein-releasing system permease protein
VAFTRTVETMLAWRYLRARRQEGFISLTSWFAVIGITLGVATLILVTSLMNGVRDEMTSRFIGIDGHVVVYGGGRAFTNYQQAMDAMKPIEAIANVAPKVSGQVMATARGRALGAQVSATSWESLSSRKLFTDHVESGSLEGLRDGTGIVLGSSLARNLGVEVGETVTLISPQGRATIAGFIPRMKAYPVVGTIKLGMHEFDSSLILMPFTEAQNYFLLMTPEGDSVSNLEVMVKNVGDAPSVANEIREKLNNTLRVYDWQQTNASVFAALAVQRNVMVVILALIILVAAFNIISS